MLYKNKRIVELCLLEDSIKDNLPCNKPVKSNRPEKKKWLKFVTVIDKN